MAMKLVRKTADYKIFLRGDNRYAVQNAAGKPVNGEEKVDILIAAELVTVSPPPAPEPEVVEAEEAPEEEAPAEESAAEEAPAADQEAPADKEASED